MNRTRFTVSPRCALLVATALVATALGATLFFTPAAYSQTVPPRAVVSHAVVSSVAANNAIVARNRQAFDAVWGMTRDHFYDPKMRGLDWKTVGERYRARALAAPDKRAFQIVVNQMLGELKASHLAYFTDDDLEWYLLQSLFSPSFVAPRQATTARGATATTATMRRRFEIDRPDLVIEHIGVTGTELVDTSKISGDNASGDNASGTSATNGVTKAGGNVVATGRRAFVVRAILDGSPAAKAGLRVGDHLLSAGGRPFSTVGAWRGRAGKATPLLLERAGVGRITVSISPIAQGPQAAFLEATRRSVRIISSGGKKLGYIHLWCMTHPAFQAVFEDALTRRFAQTDGLILDLRDGFGGTPFGWSDVLFRPAIEFRIKARAPETEPKRRAEPNAAASTTGASGAKRNADSARTERGVSIIHTGYDKPMVLLINGGTRSSKEYFAYQIKKSRRGTLLGTPTAGAFLAAGGWKISTDGYLELPIMQLALDGDPIEGHGVAPDVVVEGPDAYSPRDSQLMRATQILLDKLRP